MICGVPSVPSLGSETGSSSTHLKHLQWLTEDQSQHLSTEKLAEIREEIGDVMIYLTELADKLGIDPVEAAKAKVAINGQKYPAELVRGKASKYTEYS
jgi:dCTP diphosphatase